MAVTQIIKWMTNDGSEWDTEGNALAHEAYLMRKEELAQVLDPIWWSGVEKDEVIQALLANFTLTRKD